jgi:hypothetical protein
MARFWLSDIEYRAFEKRQATAKKSAVRAAGHKALERTS